jgi:hypothetical protein
MFAPRTVTRTVTHDLPAEDDLDRYRCAVEQLVGDALALYDEADLEMFFAFVIACYDRGNAAPECARRWAETRPGR